MFDNPRYLTSGVQSRIPLVMQLFIWQLIDDRRESQQLDYLQIFILSVEIIDGKEYQRLIHKQEQPEYHRTYSIYGIDLPVSEKIYVIDDGDHSTMLLAHEY